MIEHTRTSDQARCGMCGAEITWQDVTRADGTKTRVPYDADGLFNHRHVCHRAPVTRRMATTEERRKIAASVSLL